MRSRSFVACPSKWDLFVSAEAPFNKRRLNQDHRRLESSSWGPRRETLKGQNLMDKNTVCQRGRQPTIERRSLSSRGVCQDIQALKHGVPEAMKKTEADACNSVYLTWNEKKIKLDKISTKGFLERTFIRKAGERINVREPKPDPYTIWNPQELCSNHRISDSIKQILSFGWVAAWFKTHKKLHLHHLLPIS